METLILVVLLLPIAVLSIGVGLIYRSEMKGTTIDTKILAGYLGICILVTIAVLVIDYIDI